MKTSLQTIRRLAVTFITVALASCGSVQVNAPEAQQDSTPTPAPTSTPAATATPEPTLTVAPTVTAKPSATAMVKVKPQATAEADRADQIAITPLAEAVKVDYARSTLLMQMEGEDTRQGVPVEGELSMDVLVNNAAQRHAVVVQGDLMGMLDQDEFANATKVALYNVEGDTYQYVETGEQATCQRTEDDSSAEILSPEDMLDSFVQSQRMYGEQADEQEVNGIATNHYTLDVHQTRAAARESGSSSWVKNTVALVSGDLYLAMQGNYIVRLTADYEGELSQFNLDGKLTMNYDLAALNSEDEVMVELPDECGNATSEEAVTPEPKSRDNAASEPITFKSASDTVDVESLKSVVTIEMDGEDDEGEPMQGDVVIEMIKNTSLDQQSIVMEGKLLTKVMRQPSLEPLKLSRVGIYKIEGATYIHMQSGAGGANLCVKTAEAQRELELAFAMLSPDSLADSLASGEDMYGRLLGDETINDVTVRHYQIDAEASNAALLKSKKAEVRQAARRQKILSGDVYVASEGDYLVRLSAEYEGTADSFNFVGNMTIVFDLTEVNSGVEVELPQACETPIEP